MHDGAEATSREYNGSDATGREFVEDEEERAVMEQYLSAEC